MSAINKIPTNRNFLSPLGFAFEINKTPGVNYFVQSASIPSISTWTEHINTPFQALKYPGERVEYSDLSITFRVDEELRNYMELYTWMRDTTRSGGFEGYQSLVSAAAGTGNGVFSDGTLTILSSSKNPIAKVTFLNMYPNTLSELVFSTSMMDVDYMDVVATFTYQSYSIEYLI